jgi:hypothetical protein
LTFGAAQPHDNLSFRSKPFLLAKSFGIFMADVRHILPVDLEQTTETSPEPRDRSYAVSNQNRWSRTILEFRNLTSDAWCELKFQLAWHPEESSRLVHDFAVIGLDFRTEDGSSIDFAYVPGLTRTQIDPHSHYVAGPDYYDCSSNLTGSASAECTFLVPSPAKHVSVTFRSWRNSHPFTVINPRLEQVGLPDADADQAKGISFRQAWSALTTEPVWFRYGVVPDQPMFIRGQLINEGASGDGGLARIIFRNTQGKILPPPDDLSISPAIGAYIDIPAHRQTRRFTMELTVPAQAATVELGFQAWRDEASLSLVTPLEVSLSEDLLLENILDDELNAPLPFLKELLRRLGRTQDVEAINSNPAVLDETVDRKALTSSPTLHEKLKAVQKGQGSALANGQLTLSGLEPWPLPEEPEWTEDPFRSPAWRMEYHSLSWLLDIAKDKELGGSHRAINLALSWIRTNPWGQSRDPLSAYPSSVAVRAEVLLQLLGAARAKGAGALKTRHELIAAVIQHACALSEVLSQNIFLHSLLQIRVAGALLAVSRVLRRFSLSPYWASIALTQLRHGFDRLAGPGGHSIEQSQHFRLEGLSLGLILAHSLEGSDELHDLREELLPRLKDGLRVAVAITDPSGMLPPFGDVHLNHHHASWVRRLIAGYGKHLLSDQRLVEELSYPTGPRVFISRSAGIASFRHYDHSPNWGYLCASFNGQRHENGHYDCTSFVYAAGGVKWVTDPGGSQLFETGAGRQYLTSSRAHNVAIPDGREQSEGESWIKTAISREDANIVQIATTIYGPSYDHLRTIICLSDLSAVAVFDRFGTFERPVTFEAYLHFGESIAVALASSQLATCFHKRSRLQVIPYSVAGQFCGMQIQNGRSDRPGHLQGFVSGQSRGLQPANVLSYSFSGSEKTCGGVILVTSAQGYKRILRILQLDDIQALLR